MGLHYRYIDPHRSFLRHPVSVRNMAVLASVQDRVEIWNKSVKMPQVQEDSGERQMYLSLTMLNLQ